MCAGISQGPPGIHHDKNTMKVAVIGAGGFIGRRVLSALAGEKTEVIAVARDLEQVSDLPAAKRVALDVCEPSDNAFERIHSPNIVIYLVWGGLPNYRSLHHFETEPGLHYRFLKSLVLQGLTSLVVTGTCAEYGMRCGALSEDMPPAPVHAYGHGKATLCKNLELLQHVHPFHLTWTRLFYTYGDGQHESSLFSQLRSAVMRKDRTFDMSGGEQLRDYLPVEQLGRHIVAMARQCRDIGIVNVCSGRPQSVRTMVETWLAEYEWEIDLNFGHHPYPDHEPMAFWGDRTRLDEALSYR
jgi:dTDP-6-deoxy-L-talose 4-dehydrogenase (NAD+)